MNGIFRSASLVAALLVAGTAPMFADTTLFSQSTATPGNGGSLSVITQSDPSESQQVYDNFTLTSGATLTHVAWTAFRYTNLALDGVTIGIYGNSAQNDPGALLYQTTITGDNNEVTLFQSGDFSVNLYQAMLNIDLPTAGQYWLSIQGIMQREEVGLDGTYNWNLADNGDLTSFIDVPNGRLSNPADYSFALAGNVDPSPTPEPSALMLTGTGLVGFVGMMRRRFVRR